MRGAVVALVVIAALFQLTQSSLAPPRGAEGGGCSLPLIMGDLNGTEVVAANDALWLLRRNAGLIVSLPPCSPEDVDCDGARTAVDALKILRYVAGLAVTQTEPCVDIGSEIPP